VTDTQSGFVVEPDPDRVVEVLPRYLAGRGSFDLAVVWPFPADQGWTVHAPPLGQRIATSPCQRVRCGSNEGQRTVVEVRREPFAAPTWGAAFDWETPTELLADFHAQLLRSYGHADRPLESFLVDHARPMQVYLPLLAAGWTTRSAPAVGRRSPAPTASPLCDTTTHRGSTRMPTPGR